ncbi:hypothetical protein B0H17DRAFT_9697 [Mycena rosella]|uniref:Uncharacterized protein n=1 Tax=Mycena rosella TaxID=1033263 RepID=A0AAD7GSQ0_MYCRO|nr:hypothetical protein B0H17DRAFT_9697 [Mycena rosella]
MTTSRKTPRLALRRLCPPIPSLRPPAYETFTSASACAFYDPTFPPSRSRRRPSLGLRHSPLGAALRRDGYTHTHHTRPFHLPLDTVLRRVCDTRTATDTPIAPPSSRCRPPSTPTRFVNYTLPTPPFLTTPPSVEPATPPIGLQPRQVESSLKMDRRGSAGLGRTSLLPPMPRRPFSLPPPAESPVERTAQVLASYGRKRRA